MSMKSRYSVLGLNGADIVIISISIIFFVFKVVLASNNQFLHDWDERFHALVAKNLMANPFTPLLRLHPVLDYDMADWCCNHIWLHKPPLTLWGMALSLKIFGLNVTAVRLFSIVVSTATIWINYRFGKLMLSERMGVIMGVMTALSYYHLELSLGVLRVDHVDTLFIFLISCASYAFLKLYLNPRRKWVLIAGLLTGLAILTKWLLGLFPFTIFCCAVLLHSKTRWHLKTWVSGFASFLIGVAVSSVWFIYTLLQYPGEARQEWAYNVLHLVDAVENSGGTVFTYLKLFHWQYGILAWPLMLLGMYWAYRKRHTLGAKGIFMGSGVVLIYLFFSIVSQTRLPSYILIASSFVFFYMALGVDRALTWLSRYNALKVFALLAIGYSLLAPHNLIEVHIMKKDTHLIDASVFNRKEHNTEIYKGLTQLDLPDQTIIFNLPEFEDVECMFWTDFNCYHWWPTESELNMLLDSGHHVVAFKDHGLQVMPDYIKSNSRIKILEFDLH